MTELIYTIPFAIFSIGIIILGVSTLVYNIKNSNKDKNYSI
jgi:hypothetical protein